MGAGVSDWRLARAVSSRGQLGVVSGTALDQIFARRLQDGDPGGAMRRGLDHFPFPAMAERIRRAYYVSGGKAPDAAYLSLPLPAKDNPRALQELCLVANFVEVWLARQGHGHPVGINYLETIQIPHLPSLYGAMLAGVGCVLMGAGIPTRIPGVLDALARHQPASYGLQVTGAQPDDDTTLQFDPADFQECELPPLARPRFFAIASSHVLAASIVQRANGRVDGLIVEGPTAGGHNAPPRGALRLDAAGEPIYGDRDRVDLERVRALGLPFWLAGEYGTPERLRQALAAGAAGVQVGTPFAFCSESGLARRSRHAILAGVAAGAARVATDPRASPTHFPFKVVQLPGSLSDAEVYATRPRICDLGYLREAYRTPEGEIGFRCAAEPASTYVAKGGALADTLGRKCLCNALLANIGLAQRRNGQRTEPRLLTAGNGLLDLARFLPAGGGWDYSAGDVLRALLAPAPAGAHS